MLGLGLAALPQKLLAEAVGFVVETVVIVAITWHFTANHYEQKEQAEKAAAATVAASAAIESQNETNRRVTEQQLIAKNAQLQSAQANAEAASAVAARDSMRVQLDAYVRAHRATADSSITTGSAPAGDPIGLLASLYADSDSFAERAAKEADANRIAGLACEQAYDSLTKH